MRHIHSDGGRKLAGYKGGANDCFVRALAIAAQENYQYVYDLVNRTAKSEKRKLKSSAREGVYLDTAMRVMNELGWTWVPTMSIGSGCRVHLRREELPEGRLVVRVSRHYTAVIEGVLCDTHDCSRGGNRCVYGYWHKPAPPAPPKVRMVCEVCGAIEVTRDATARWSETDQRWELAGVQDQGYCDECGCETSIQEVPLKG